MRRKARTDHCRIDENEVTKMNIQKGNTAEVVDAMN
jgi:hypothetical protein